MRRFFCLIFPLVLGCGEIDNSKSIQGGEKSDKSSEAPREIPRELPSHDRKEKAEEPDSPSLDRLETQRAEGQSLPLLFCSSYLVSKTNPHEILTELKSFAEHKSGKLVPLPGFRQDDTEGHFLSSTYSYDELGELCARGLQSHFQRLSEKSKTLFGKEKDELLMDYEVSKTRSHLAFFVLMPDKSYFEVVSTKTRD